MGWDGMGWDGIMGSLDHGMGWDGVREEWGGVGWDLAPAAPSVAAQSVRVGVVACAGQSAQPEGGEGVGVGRGGAGGANTLWVRATRSARV